MDATVKALDKCNQLSEDVSMQKSNPLKEEENVVPFKKGKVR